MSEQRFGEGDNVPPPLPIPEYYENDELMRLRHLIYFVPPDKAVGFDEENSEALFDSITDLDLETLVLPRGLWIPEGVVDDIVVSLPDLVTLVASGHNQIPAVAVQDFEDLRLLDARAIEGCVPAGSPRPGDLGPDGKPQEQFSELTQLESLSLTQSGFEWISCHMSETPLAQLSFLACLTHLKSKGYACRPELLAQIAAAPRLRALTMDCCPELQPGRPCPLRALYGLTSLQLLASEGDRGGARDGPRPRLTTYDLQTIGSLTTLRHLQLIAADKASVVGLGALTRLVSLKLIGRCCDLVTGFFGARGDDAIRAAKACSPGLQHLRHLEDLSLFGCRVSDQVLQAAATLPWLRRLIIRFCTKYTIEGLTALCGCARLLFVDAQEPPVFISARLRASLPFAVLTDEHPPPLADLARIKAQYGGSESDSE